MVLKNTKKFHSKAIQNIPKVGILDFKIYHLATPPMTKNKASLLDKSLPISSLLNPNQNVLGSFYLSLNSPSTLSI
jgi:hypothetical protein